MKTAEDLETEVGRLPAGVPVPLTPEEARALLDCGRYRAHGGLGRGLHFRARKGEGCYHLIIRRGRPAELHWDQWDPRRYPLRHLLEVPKLKRAARMAALLTDKGE